MRFSLVLGAMALLAAAGVGAAHAQDSLIYPDMGSDLTAPRYFDGLYTGVYAGAIGNERHNYFGGGDRAYGLGVLGGWNTYVTPSMIVGGEVQGGVGYDFAGNFRYDAFALLHLGFTTTPDVQFYWTGGIGWFDTAPAYALGVGFEAAVTDNMAFRTEALALGQVGAVPSGNNYPGISAWKITSGLVWHFGEGGGASDVPPTTDFGGLYTAAYFGGVLNFPYNFFPDTGQGLHLTRLSYGGAVGWNQEIADHIVAGVELQGGMLFDTSGDVTADLLALGRIGLVPMDGLFVYAEGGVGVLAGKTAFALGGGAEYALWGNASLRADVLAIGELNATPVVSGISATKFQIGPVWHFD